MTSPFLILPLLYFLFTSVFADDIQLTRQNFAQITFKNIPPTQYHFNADGLAIKVDRSASGLIHAFKTPVKMTGFMALLKHEGKLLIQSAAQEQSKAGDDSYLRIGLIIKGPERTIPFFAPSWVKQIRQHLNSGFKRVIYYHVDSKNKPGSHWLSPYTSEITIKSIASQSSKTAYRKLNETFDKPLLVVGIIIMSDGDNTKSKFQTKLKRLQFTRARK